MSAPTRPGTPGGAPPSAGAAVRTALLALVALQALVAAAYAVALPTWRAPDEPSHYDMVLVAREGGGWPAHPGDRRLHRQIEASYDVVDFELADRRRDPPLVQADALPRPARPTFDELADDVADGAGNGMFQHPPGYYVVAAAAANATFALVPGSGAWPFDTVVLLTRLVGAVLAAPLPWLAWRAARHAGADEPAALTAAALPVAIPQLAHVTGAVNNDALLIPATGALTVAALAVAAGDLSRRRAMLVGLMAGVALLAKGFALFAPALVVPAYLLGVRRRRRRGEARAVRDGVVGVAVAGALALAVGGWFWLRNLARHGEIQPTGAALPAPPDGFSPQLGAWLGEAATRLPARFWGAFGWHQADLPGLLVALAVTATLVGVVAALAGRGQPARRADVALALVPVAAIGGIVLYGAWTYYAQSGIVAALQGRYLLPGVVGLAVACGAGWAGMVGRLRPWTPVLVVAAGLVLHAAAALAVLGRFYGPVDGGTLADRAAALAAWAPLPRAGLVLLLLGVGVAAATAVHGLLDCARVWHVGRGVTAAPAPRR